VRHTRRSLDGDSNYVSSEVPSGETLETPAESYYRGLVLALGKATVTKIRVYLDINHWIALRDVMLGRPRDPRHVEVYERLRQLVESGRLVCPVSECVFFEIFKQADRQTRLATARVADQLSHGITLQFSDHRLQTEVIHFLRQCSGKGDSLYPLEQLVWTKAAHVLGRTYPVFAGLPPDESMHLQKMATDMLWECTLEQLVDALADSRPVSTIYTEESAKELNKGKIAHAHEIKTYEDAFLAELGGVVDLYTSTFAKMMRWMYVKDTGRALAQGDMECDEPGKLMRNLIFHAFRLGRITTQLPSFMIHSHLHATIRFDRPRKLRPNDLWDFRHAVAGVPFCDIFVSDRGLASLVTSPRLAFDKLYNTRVVTGTHQLLDVLPEP